MSKLFVLVLTLAVIGTAVKYTMTTYLSKDKYVGRHRLTRFS